MKQGFIPFIPLTVYLIIVLVIFGGLSYYSLPQLATIVCTQEQLLQLMGKLKGGSLDVDHCLKGAAVWFNIVPLCDEIKGTPVVIGGKEFQMENPPKMECYTTLAAQRKDPALCEKVSGALIANTRIDCLFRVAKAKKDLKVCDLIRDEEQSRAGYVMNKNSCKTRVGEV